jgi:hemoglobin-like flavoprotein
VSLHVELLEESFDLVIGRGDDLVSAFYRRVLANPNLAPLFGGVAMDLQKLKFLSTLLALRNAWRRLTDLEPELEALGARHAAYGVEADQYPILCAALLEAMEEIAGSAWKPEYGESWRAAYAVVQESMLRGAASATVGGRAADSGGAIDAG